MNGRGERLFAHELQEALASLGLDSFSLEDIKNFIHYYDRCVHIKGQITRRSPEWAVVSKDGKTSFYIMSLTCCVLFGRRLCCSGYAGGVTCDEFSLLAHYLYRVYTDLQPKERFVAQGTKCSYDSRPWLHEQVAVARH